MCECIGRIMGNVNRKVIDGHAYLYWDYADPSTGQRKQRYLGREDNPDVLLEAKELRTGALLEQAARLKAKLEAENPERLRAIFKYQSHGGRKLSVF